jgi:hypothetical protein
VSTWKISLNFTPSCCIAINRSTIGSQLRLRAKLSSVMKNLRTPCATFLRTIASTSSGVRKRDLRPWTLMMVQNEHWNGQPRPASKLVYSPATRATILRGRIGSVASAISGMSER